jgi:hypothetical protein
MKTTKKSIIAIFGLALMTGAACVAEAQAARPYHYRHHADYFMSEGRSIYAPVCAPLCARDLTPCDPTYFKLADGRCAGIESR